MILEFKQFKIILVFNLNNLFFISKLLNTYSDPLLNDCYTIRWFENKDLPYYIEGLNMNLYDCYDEARFKWKMVNTPFSLGFASIVVVEYGNEPVAFNSFLPLKVRRGSEIFTIVQGCDGFVNPDHRRMGLFQETIRFMSTELSGKGPEMLMGFNFAGATGAAQKAGSTVTCDVEKWTAKVSDIIKLEINPDVLIEETTLNDISRIYESWVSDTDLYHYYRAPEYLSWRYSHPLRKSHFFRITYGDLIGYVIASLEFENDKSFNIFIEDYTPMISKVKVLSAAIEKFLLLHDKIHEISFTTLSNSSISLASLTLGFQPESMYKLIMKPIIGLESIGNKLFRNGIEITKIDKWHITCSDVY